MQITINAQQFDHLPFGEAATRISTLGATAIELWPSNHEIGPGDAGTDRYTAAGVAHVRRIVAERHLRVSCVTHGFHVMRLDASGPGGISAAADELVRTAEAAVALGAPLVNCYLAGLPGGQFIAVAKLAAPRIRALNIRVALENEAHDDSATADGVAAILDQLDDASFGTTFDPCNYVQGADEPYPAAWERLRQRVLQVHLKGGSSYRADAGLHQGGTIRNRSDAWIGYGPLERSAYPVAALVRRLIADGYGGGITLEPHLPPDQVEAILGQDLAYLRGLLANASAAARNG